MAKKVPIEFFNIQKTQVVRSEVERWLKFIGVSDKYEIPADGAISEPALLIALAGKRCYMSFEVGLNPNVSKIREDWCKYLDNILASGHGSVIEHCVYSFAIENVSRVFTGEMNRHRAGWAISEGSMRFIRFSDDVPYWEPDSVQGPSALDGEKLIAFGEMCYPGLYEAMTREGNNIEQRLTLKTLEEKKHASRIMLERTFDMQRDWYKVMEAIWADELKETSMFSGKKALTSMFRRGIGMGCATGGVWTGNMRALRHVIATRAAEGAEEEILHVFSGIAKFMVESEPYLFGDFEQVDGKFWKPKYRKV